VGVTANANTVRNNIVSSSLNDGFLADTSSGGNTILHNSSQLNGNLDAQDLSTGAGTAGTDNSWEADNCTTSSPSGLCHTAATTRIAAEHSKVTVTRGTPRRGRDNRHGPWRASHLDAEEEHL
jgi:hypothetical protein